MDGSRLVGPWSEEMFDVLDYCARLMARRCGGEYDDLFQEGCLAVAIYDRRHGRWPVSARYLIQAATNRMRSSCGRARRREFEARYRELRAYAASSAPPPPHEADDARIDVADALEALPDRHREALRSVCVDGLPCRDLPEPAGGSARTKERFVARLRDEARDRLGGYGPEDARVRLAPIDPSWSRRSRDRGKDVDWSRWGPIPNQRDDD